MKLFALMLLLLFFIPSVQAINISCDWDYSCSGGDLHRISDCLIDNETFYIDEALDCEFGCDTEYNQCKIPPYYESVIIFPILIGSFLIARWVWVKKRGVKR